MNDSAQQFFGKNRFFKIAAGGVVLIALSFGIPLLFYPALVILGILIAYTLVDFMVLYQLKKPLECNRHHQLLLSLADQNKIELRLKNRSSLKLKLKIVDELPEQLQIRDLELHDEVSGNTTKVISYFIRPTLRGSTSLDRLSQL